MALWAAEGLQRLKAAGTNHVRVPHEAPTAAASEAYRTGEKQACTKR